MQTHGVEGAWRRLHASAKLFGDANFKRHRGPGEEAGNKKALLLELEANHSPQKMLEVFERDGLDESVVNEVREKAKGLSHFEFAVQLMKEEVFERLDDVAKKHAPSNEVSHGVEATSEGRSGVEDEDVHDHPESDADDGSSQEM